jgi:hypothetical protein
MNAVRHALDFGVAGASGLGLGLLAMGHVRGVLICACIAAAGLLAWHLPGAWPKD